MTLLVRNEEDVLRDNIEYHFSRGVDYILATDNGSEDSTRVVLDYYQKQGRLDYIVELSDDYSQSVWVTRMAREAAIRCSADWVINNDADEFWWPTRGDLKTTLAEVPAEIGVVHVPRQNFAPVGTTIGKFWESQTLQERESKNSLGLPLPGKVCHRGDPLVEVAQGNHSILGGRFAGQTPFPVAIDIYHFPLRTYPQFEKKIKLGGAAYERNVHLEKNVGKTWRDLYAIYLAGNLPDWYAGQVATQEDVQAGRLVENEQFKMYMLNLEMLTS